MNCKNSLDRFMLELIQYGRTSAADAGPVPAVWIKRGETPWT